MVFDLVGTPAAVETNTGRRDSVHFRVSQPVVINEWNLKKILADLRNDRLDPPITNIDGRIASIGNRKVIMVDFEVDVRGVPLPVKAHEVYFSRIGRTYVASCVARKDHYARVSATFDEIVSSFQELSPVPGKTLEQIEKDQNAAFKAELGNRIPEPPPPGKPNVAEPQPVVAAAPPGVPVWLWVVIGCGAFLAVVLVAGIIVAIFIMRSPKATRRRRRLHVEDEDEFDPPRRRERGRDDRPRWET